MRNPISPKRQEVLKKAFAKVKDLEQVMLWAGEADPTKSGEYASWIISLHNRNIVRLPEDIDKIKNKLEIYHRKKARLPLEQRHIHNIATYGDLAKIVEPLEQRKTKQETKQAAISGTETIDTISPDSRTWYEVVKISTVEAAASLCRDTEWCVKDPRWASKYLSRGPLFLIKKIQRAIGFDDGYHSENYVLVHVEDRQINDVYDNEIELDVEEELIPVWLHFQEFKPLLCQEHDEYPDVGLTIRECPDCGKQNKCSKCIAENQCFECSEPGCDNCRFECGNCDKIACSRHYSECYSCDKGFCLDCLTECGGDKSDDRKTSYICEMCIDNHKCTNCSNVYCEDSLMSSCERCGEASCPDCSAACSVCDDLFCGTHLTPCQVRRRRISQRFFSQCEAAVCQKCVEICNSCRHDMCEDCRNQCEVCDEYFCSECKEDGKPASVELGEIVCPRCRAENEPEELD